MEVMIVPYIGAIAPNLSVTGFHDCVDDRGDDHPAEKQENHPSRGQGQKVKRCITEFESGKNFGQPRRGLPPLGVLNRHIAGHRILPFDFALSSSLKVRHE
jgi:hypothetical protein